MTRMSGSHGQIKADPTGVGSSVTVIGSMNSWTLNMARDKYDVTAFQDSNKVYVQGLQDIKGTVGGWFDSDELTLFDIAMGEIAAFLNLVPNSQNATLFWKGPAWLDSAIDVKATGAITVTGNFNGAGPWTFMHSLAATAAAHGGDAHAEKHAA